VKAFIFERNGEPAYGHTAGLTAYILENGGEKVMFWGDVVNIALEVDNPDISLSLRFRRRGRRRNVKR
jgi:glyoxylase-like metal-dependent hydrolase (beta-lactamase superfamily II)